MDFRFALNPDVAFSLPLGGFWLAWVLAAAVSALVWWAVRCFMSGRPWEALALSVVVLGAASNLFDRFRYGAVIDYLDLRWFTVFNLADVLIVLGVAGLLWIEWRKR
jgi:signal peptidase II